MAAALVLAAAGLGACAEPLAVPGARSPLDAGPRPRLRVVASEYNLSVPSLTAGGVVDLEFENLGTRPHQALVLGTGGRSIQEVLDAFRPVVERPGSPIADFLVAGGGATETEPGGTTRTTMVLPPGEYLVLCTLTDAAAPAADTPTPPDGDPAQARHFDRGMLATLTVTDPGSGPGDRGGVAALPPTDARVVARDGGLAVTGLEAGDETVSFTNEGPAEIHNAVVFEYPGVDPAGAAAAFRARFQDQPGPPGTAGGRETSRSAVFDPGRGGTFRGAFRPGHTYVFACFVGDRAGGPPHAVTRDMFTAVGLPD